MTCCGVALVARSQSFGARPRRRSRRLPPTTHARKPARSMPPAQLDHGLGNGPARNVRSDHRARCAGLSVVARAAGGNADARAPSRQPCRPRGLVTRARTLAKKGVRPRACTAACVHLDTNLMNRWLRPLLALFAVAAAFCVTFVWPQQNGLNFDIDTSPRAQAAKTRVPYDLSQVRVLKAVITKVNQNYVEPERIDHRKMLLAGLNAIQGTVPPVLVHYENGAGTFKVQVNDQVGRVPRRRRELAVVADLALPGDLPLPAEEPASRTRTSSCARSSTRPSTACCARSTRTRCCSRPRSTRRCS